MGWFWAAPPAGRAKALRYDCGFLVAICLLLAACGSVPPPEEESDAAYVQSVVAAREIKDRFMTTTESPIPQGEQQKFLPLAYFPPDPAYRVPASLRPSGDSAIIKMPTSTGQMRDMHTVGTLEFTLKGQPLTLGAFIEAGADLNRLFVPFSDMTSGTETYPAGRYLDLDRTPTGIYVIDFNGAYHPYCYFSATYDCPYPPPQNRLKMVIHAGEKLRKQ